MRLACDRAYIIGRFEITCFIRLDSLVPLNCRIAARH